MANLRYYKSLPVWVVENHDEVLEPIYRAIATKHLPFECIAMLHFDSHPDMQIDTEMPADTVFDKQELFSTLSIENWIMPAVYAGHLCHVTWVKPPWADQLPVGSRRVKVGKHRTSGKMRINWPDSYFVSDVLFTPATDLENTKEAVISVVTMETTCLKACQFSDTLMKTSLNKVISTDVQCKDNSYFGEEGEKTRHEMNTNCAAEGKCDNMDTVRGNACKRLSSGEITNPVTENLHCDQILNSVRNEMSAALSKCNDGNKQALKESSIGRNQPQKCKQSQQTLGNRNMDDNQEEINEHISEERNDDKEQGQICEQATDSSYAKSVYKETEESERQEDSSLVSKVTLDDVAQQFSEFKGRYILDVDLDFFSTRNPFKEMYSKDQYNLLEELYDFAAPSDDSLAALEQCQVERTKQISELLASMKAAFSGTGYVAACGCKERFEKVLALVESLKSSPGLDPECLDPDLVHMAGLTCDSHGDLPHHVSNEEEIDSLVASMKQLLGNIPPPVMVTVARSSRDDYCPADQVDMIQQKVLSLLQSLYGQLDIHMSYLQNQ